MQTSENIVHRPVASSFQLDVGGFVMRDGNGQTIGYVFVESDGYAKTEHWILLSEFQAPGAAHQSTQWRLEHDAERWERLDAFLEFARGMREKVGKYIVATCVETEL